MTTAITLRRPVSEDGRAVFTLIMECPPLDINSVYCNLLQCSHFRDTSVIATDEQGAAGFISGYIIPDRPDTLFIWQVAVSDRARGQGLARRMLDEILQRPQCAEVRHVETTITEDNAASWALFESLARGYQATLKRSLMFDKKLHFGDRHDSEILARIGPLQFAEEQKQRA